MSQSPREVMKATLQMKGPERLPVRMGCFDVDDSFWINRRTDEHSDEQGRKVDEWGCYWKQTEMANMGQVKGHPLADVHEYAKAHIPDYTQSWRYDGIAEEFARAEKEDRYTQVGIFMVLFERMHSLAGFENVLMGLLADPENTAALADKILNAQISLVRNYQDRFGKHLHSFNMTDDWGTQQAAFIDMGTWNTFFLPRYKKLFDVMHEGGQDVWVHSCGKVNEVIQGLINAGCDAVNLQQPRALGIEDIGVRYRGKITFESLSDIQVSLPTGRKELITADAQALARHWMSPKGGFVLSDYGDGAAIGAPIEAKRMMYEAFSVVSKEMYGKALPKMKN